MTTAISVSVPDRDLDEYIRELAVVFSKRDIPFGFLLGAGCGCSVPSATGGPLIPAIHELSQEIYDDVRASTHRAELELLEKQFQEDGLAALPNIEILLNRVRTLREVAGKGTVRGLSAAALDDLDDVICRKVETRVACDLPAGENSYTDFATWAKEIIRSTPVEIFTTNYDLLLEQAFERVRAPFFDGFVGASEPFFDISTMEFDRLPVRWTLLWKIHGSINWRFAGEGSITRSREASRKPLIFPSYLKYAESRRLPYLAMRDRLRRFFDTTPSVFVTCGYSFGDDHINEDIVNGLASNRNAVCYAVVFDNLAAYPEAVRLAERRSNLNLLAADGGVLRGREVKWIAGPSLRCPGDFGQFGRLLRADVMGRI